MYLFAYKQVQYVHLRLDTYSVCPVYLLKNKTMETENQETQNPCPVCLRTIQQINEGSSDCYCIQ